MKQYRILILHENMTFPMIHYILGRNEAEIRVLVARTYPGAVIVGEVTLTQDNPPAGARE